MSLLCREICWGLAIAGALIPRLAPAEFPPAEPTKSVIGKSLQGASIPCEVFGSGSDVLMVIATIHGNEAAGTPLLAAFGEWLRSHPDELAGRKVVLLPLVNPDGYAAGERFNSRGVDLNRNFPAGNWRVEKVSLHGETPLSEPESRAIMRAICEYFPDRIVSIHQPVACVDYDGPAEKLAEAMAAAGPLPVNRLGGQPGSLGSFIGETLGKPIVTWELPEDAGMDAEVLWKTYGESLLAALRFAEPARE
jgi:protein MpaA